jgi:hypothetical protein
VASCGDRRAIATSSWGGKVGGTTTAVAAGQGVERSFGENSFAISRSGGIVGQRR